VKNSKTDKRTRLLDAANRLVQQQGFNRTTLADIAEKSKVPLGNVYYYFKTKDEIGHALIEYRTGRICGQFSEWDKLPEPRKRILAAIEAVADNRENLAQSGCPIGSLCQELHKDGGPLADRAAGMFTVLLEWLEVQFRLLGMGKESSGHALHLVSALQGASLLTNAFNDSTLMLRETARLKKWVNAL
jgi:AcrR family transcriptional regulator